MNEAKTTVGQATDTIQKIADGKLPKLLTLIPKGQSPKLYLDLIKSQIMGVDQKGNPRPDEDLLLFLYVAKRTGLDPLTKQIYAIYRWNSRQGREVMTIQSSIDAMRLVGQRSNAYAGQDDVVYNPTDESTKYPIKASVTVYKILGGQRVPFTATARWNEYVQTDAKGMPSMMWERMPYLMLGKCAEALALRKAFPNELSGIYADEEMAQSRNVLEGLSAPTKTNIEVVHGAPDEAETATPPVPSEPGKAPEAPANAPKVILATKEKPDFKAMHAALKPAETTTATPTTEVKAEEPKAAKETTPEQLKARVEESRKLANETPKGEK